MRSRAEEDINKIKNDPFPLDLIDAYTWADEKGLSQKYVRTLIKSKEGSLLLEKSYQDLLQRLFNQEQIRVRKRGSASLRRKLVRVTSQTGTLLGEQDQASRKV